MHHRLLLALLLLSPVYLCAMDGTGSINGGGAAETTPLLADSIVQYSTDRPTAGADQALFYHGYLLTKTVVTTKKTVQHFSCCEFCCCCYCCPEASQIGETVTTQYTWKKSASMQ